MERDCLREKAERTMPSLLVHSLGEFSDFSCHIVTDLRIYLFIIQLKCDKKCDKCDKL